MKNMNLSAMLNGVFIVFLLATFVVQYESMFITRIILLGCSLGFLLMEFNKRFFAKNKNIVIGMSIASLFAVSLGLVLDYKVLEDANFASNFFVPVYVYILAVILYRELYQEKIN